MILLGSDFTWIGRPFQPFFDPNNTFDLVWFLVSFFSFLFRVFSFGESLCVVWVVFVFVFSVFVLFDLFGLKECCNVPTTRAMMSRHLHVRERAKQGRLHSNNYDSTTIYKARTEDRTKTDVPVPGIVVSLSYSAMKDSLGSPLPKLVLVSFYHLAASAQCRRAVQTLAGQKTWRLPVDLCVKALQNQRTTQPRQPCPSAT